MSAKSWTTISAEGPCDDGPTVTLSASIDGRGNVKFKLDIGTLYVKSDGYADSLADAINKAKKRGDEILEDATRKLEAAFAEANDELDRANERIYRIR